MTGASQQPLDASAVRARLSSRENESKERLLTQAQPAHVTRSSDAVVLKEGDAFLLSDEAGDVPFGLPHGFGLFSQDCRFLDGYQLSLNEAAPIPLSSSDARGFETLHHLTNADLPAENGAPIVPQNTIAICRQRVLREGVLHERMTFHNHGRRAASFRVTLRFRAQFHDLFVVRGFVGGPEGRREAPHALDGTRIEWRYGGSDGVRRRLLVTFAAPPTSLEADRAAYDLRLGPQAASDIVLTIRPVVDAMSSRDREQAGRSPESLRRWLERAEERWIAESAHVESSSDLFDRVLRRALLDLHLLHSRTGGLRYYAAGVPWFATLFGRDAAVAAMQTLPYGARIARDSLRLLARLQAQQRDEFRDAEPGKILHELRRGELANAGAIPQSPTYYGTVDATPLFVVLLAEYVRWSGDVVLARELLPNLDAALRWMAANAELDGRYLTYTGRYPNGLVNQGWKDSGDAIVNADGSLAEPPIALCEVQGYAYRAWRDAGWLAGLLGDEERAATYERRAEQLRATFAEDFWSDEVGCFVLARQAGGRAADVVSSNAGQVLWSGIAGQAQADCTVRRLLAPDMFSGWGLRTLSRDAAAYNPIGYHLGSVWPHDNAFVLRGFRNYGHDLAALGLFTALFEAASRCRNYRLPELFCGYPRGDDHSAPVPYPVACSPQAWAAGALPYALCTLLGLRANATSGELRIERPLLPPGLEWLRLRNVGVGPAHVDLSFRRRDADVDVEWDCRDDGRVNVVHDREAGPELG